MLDEYKEKQNFAYNIMMNEIKKGQLSHAYLIDENNNKDAFNIVMAFVKEIFSLNLNDSEKKILCKRIDDGNFPEIKLIQPDGMLIKKKQLLDLQQEFSLSAVEGNKRVYIIRDADKMRSETANSMLKFLEEPDVNVIAILMTNCFNNILSTIVSRCQIIRLNNNIIDNDQSEIDSVCFNFIKEIENIGNRLIINEQKLIFDSINYRNRNEVIAFFDKLIDMYYDIIKISNQVYSIKFSNYIDDFKKIAMKKDNDELLKKIGYIMEAKDIIKNNVNINLLFDSLIIKLGGNDENCWNKT